jgi:hypothetical protein
MLAPVLSLKRMSVMVSWGEEDMLLARWASRLWFV